MRPATGKASSAVTVPPSATAKPPPISIRRLTAAAMSASLAPTTVMLWLSWPTEEAIAPRFRPKPRTKLLPILPLMPCRSTTATLITSLSRSGFRPLSPISRVASSRKVRIRPGLTFITGVWFWPGLGSQAKAAASTGVAFMDDKPTGSMVLRPANKSLVT